MANICMARITVLPLDDGPDTLPAGIVGRLQALSYDHCEIAMDEPDMVEVSCGFRWSPPCDDLLKLSGEYHVHVRCIYDEPGVGFMGSWHAQDGRVTKDSCIDYD